MTVDNTNNRTELSVSGFDYDFTFKIFDDSQIKVYGVDSDDALTLLTLTTDYTVDISAITEGGTVQTVVDSVPTEPAAYAKILMVRAVSFTQDADIPVRGGFNEAVIEQALDVIVMQIQQIKDLIDFDEDQDPFSVASAAAAATAAEASAVAAAASAAAADVSAGIVSDVIVAAIAEANHIVTGHDHDGANSKTVSFDDLVDVPSGLMNKQEFLTDGNFTAPAGVTAVWVTLIGGGGGGQEAGVLGTDEGAGGGGGQSIIRKRVTLDALEVVPIVIGTGGAGGTGNTAAAGSNGTATTFTANSETVTADFGRGGSSGTGGIGGGGSLDASVDNPGNIGVTGGQGGDNTGTVGGAGGSTFFHAQSINTDTGAPGKDGPANTGVGGNGGPGGDLDGGDGGSGYCLVEY